MSPVTPPTPPSESAAHRVASSDGVSLAVHDLGGDGPPLLLCHPTGFHGLTWAPLARHLADRFRCWALDFRGHGDSTLPASDDLSWRGMADDVLAVVELIGGGDEPLLGVGHSMGGAALLLAEQAHPGTWAALWCYEPIAFPRPEGRVLPGNVLAESARRRRAVFPSRDAAFANYHAKPPLNRFTSEALHAYVDHGFRSRPDGSVELKCAPETEARIFEAGLDNGAFAGLGQVACPTTVAASGDGAPPAQMAALVSSSLGNGSLRRFPELTHFGPMEDPAMIAASIAPDFVAFS